jgi:hypothetical protein
MLTERERLPITEISSGLTIVDSSQRFEAFTAFRGTMQRHLCALRYFFDWCVFLILGLPGAVCGRVSTLLKDVLKEVVDGLKRLKFDGSQLTLLLS